MTARAGALERCFWLSWQASFIAFERCFFEPGEAFRRTCRRQVFLLCLLFKHEKQISLSQRFHAVPHDLNPTYPQKLGKTLVAVPCGRKAGGARLHGGNACADGRCWACLKRPVQLPENLGAGVEKDFAPQQSAEGEVAFPELQGRRGSCVFRAAERGRSGKMTRGFSRTTSQTRLRCQGDSCFQRDARAGLWLSSDFPVDPQNDTKLPLLPSRHFVVRFGRQAIACRKVGWPQKQRRGTSRLPFAKVFDGGCGGYFCARRRWAPRAALRRGQERPPWQNVVPKRQRNRTDAFLHF